MIGEIHKKDCIFGRETDERDQPDLEIDVVGHPPKPDRGQGSEDAERHGQDHGKRHRPALVLRGEHQKHHQQAEGERHDRLVSDLAFLVGDPAPVEGVALGDEHLLRHPLQGIERLPRARAGSRRPQRQSRVVAEKVRHRVRPAGVFRRDHRVERNHGRALSVLGADVNLGDIARGRPVLRL